MPFLCGYLIFVNISAVNLDTFAKCQKHSTEHGASLETLLLLLLDSSVEVSLWHFWYGHVFNDQGHLYMGIL